MSSFSLKIYCRRWQAKHLRCSTRLHNVLHCLHIWVSGTGPTRCELGGNFTAKPWLELEAWAFGHNRDVMARLILFLTYWSKAEILDKIWSINVNRGLKYRINRNNVDILSLHTVVIVTNVCKQYKYFVNQNHSYFTNKTYVLLGFMFYH
jgi:hypothetical protein